MKTYLKYSNPADLTEFKYYIDLENSIGNLEYCYEGWIERGADKTTPEIISGHGAISIVANKPVLNLQVIKNELLDQAKSLVSSKLQETDWKVLRQYERITAKKESKILTDDEFIAFSDSRQVLRDKLNTYELAIENANSYDECMNISLGV